ncbi:MAG: metallophosphoesterase [Prevotella sp.]|jgi:predicted phosphodiesterase|nr:metallophosphoesterase [Prevotella sp.]
MRLRPSAIVLFVFLHLSGCASNPLKLGVISDVHYLSEKLLDTHRNTGVEETPAILDAVLSDYMHSDIDALLIAGDMTWYGERKSHVELVEKLRPLMDKGVRIFVAPGNHDVNIPMASEKISPAEFVEIYRDCGYASAIRRDTASLSYVAALNDKTWLLALDACRYKEYTSTSISGGKLTDSSEMWLLETLADAKKQNITVVAMLHHGLVEHFPFQSNLFPQYLIDDWRRLAGLLADNGLKAVFTGHFHANDVSEFISGSGNKIYDIETGSLSAYPFPYRFVELTDKELNISTRNLTSIPSNPDLYAAGKAKLKAWARNLGEQKIRAKNLAPNESILSQMADIAADMMLLHVAGDEALSDSLQQKIVKVAEDMEFPMQLTPENIQIDTPPVDNNVRLSF